MTKQNLIALCCFFLMFWLLLFLFNLQTPMRQESCALLNIFVVSFTVGVQFDMWRDGFEKCKTCLPFFETNLIPLLLLLFSLFLFLPPEKLNLSWVIMLFLFPMIPVMTFLNNRARNISQSSFISRRARKKEGGEKTKQKNHKQTNN